jgi:hypothetical protein
MLAAADGYEASGKKSFIGATMHCVSKLLSIDKSVIYM